MQNKKKYHEKMLSNFLCFCGFSGQDKCRNDKNIKVEWKRWKRLDVKKFVTGGKGIITKNRFREPEKPDLTDETSRSSKKWSD
jgi:hypothetical protein